MCQATCFEHTFIAFNVFITRNQFPPHLFGHANERGSAELEECHKQIVCDFSLTLSI